MRFLAIGLSLYLGLELCSLRRDSVVYELEEVAARMGSQQSNESCWSLFLTLPSIDQYTRHRVLTLAATVIQVRVSGKAFARTFGSSACENRLVDHTFLKRLRRRDDSDGQSLLPVVRIVAGAAYVVNPP